MQQNDINMKKVGLFATAGLALCALGGVVFQDNISYEFNKLKSEYQQKKIEFNNATQPDALRRAFRF